MTIDVERVAALAKLEIPHDEMPAIVKDMAQIVEMVSHLPELTETEEPLAGQETMALREDVVCPSMPVSDVLANAPNRHGDYFWVPKMAD